MTTPSAPFHHLGQDQLDQDDRRHHVRFEVAVQELDRGVENPVHVTGPDIATVVDQHVDRTELPGDGMDGGCEGCTIEQVQVDGEGP